MMFGTMLILCICSLGEITNKKVDAGQIILQDPNAPPIIDTLKPGDVGKYPENDRFRIDFESYFYQFPGYPDNYRMNYRIAIFVDKKTGWRYTTIFNDSAISLQTK